jgi:hypothetical protein
MAWGSPKLKQLCDAWARAEGMRKWYQTRIDMGYSYYAERAQMASFARYLKVLAYLEWRRLRTVRQAAA